MRNYSLSLGAKLCPHCSSPLAGRIVWGGKPRYLTPTQTLPVEEEGNDAPGEGINPCPQAFVKMWGMRNPPADPGA